MKHGIVVGIVTLGIAVPIAVGECRPPDRSVHYEGNAYHVPVVIGHKRTEALIDTGSSDVSVSAAVAKDLGLVAGDKQVHYYLADGRVQICRVSVERVTVMGITRRAQVSVCPGDGELLLGMSYLNQVAFSAYRGRLVFHDAR